MDRRDEGGVTASAIRFAHVSKRFAGAATAAVDGIDLEIPAGQFVALVGASGSGKTTTLKLVNRLVEADAGTILLRGRAVAETPLTELRRSIGYAVQGIGLFPHLTVAENIAMPLRLAGKVDAARVAELLAMVELPVDYGDRDPAALSGGERQRVGFARALATGPDILLMDEPFGALDPVTRDSLSASYRALHGRLGLTTLMVTHDMQEALLLADRIVVMEAGRIVADATPRELLSGHTSPVAAALVAVPRAQAAKLERLARG